MLAICLTTFLPFDRKRYFEATNNCIQWFARHNLFVVLVVFFVFFFVKEKRASPKHVCIINISIDVQVVNGVKHQ